MALPDNETLLDPESNSVSAVAGNKNRAFEHEPIFALNQPNKLLDQIAAGQISIIDKPALDEIQSDIAAISGSEPVDLGENRLSQLTQGAVIDSAIREESTSPTENVKNDK